MGASCKDERMALAICLQKSPCVLLERNTPSECLKNPKYNKDLPELCKAHLKTFLDCRRGMIDRSKRLSGNAPLSTGKHEEEYRRMCEGNFNAKVELENVSKMDTKKG